jgi:hypothetical protein
MMRYAMLRDAKAIAVHQRHCGSITTLRHMAWCAAMEGIFPVSVDLLELALAP